MTLNIHYLAKKMYPRRKAWDEFVQVDFNIFTFHTICKCRFTIREISGVQGGADMTGDEISQCKCVCGVCIRFRFRDVCKNMLCLGEGEGDMCS